MKDVELNIPYKKAWNILNKEDKAYVKKLQGAAGTCESVTLTFHFSDTDDIVVPAVTSFKTVWDMYGKKVGRAMCEKLWARLPSKEKELVMQHIPLYVRSTPDKQYRKNFSTYLRQRGWEDEIICEGDNGREQRIKELAERFTAENRGSTEMPF